MLHNGSIKLEGKIIVERYRGLPARELIISTRRKASRVREEVHRQHVEALRSMTRQQRLSRALEMYEVGLKLAEVGRRARGAPDRVRDSGRT